jgi:type IV secretory pathway VirB4 component
MPEWLSKLMGKSADEPEATDALLLEAGARTFVDLVAPSVLEEQVDWMQVGDVFMRGYYMADLPAGSELLGEDLIRPGAVDAWASMFVRPLPPETAVTLHRRQTELAGTEIFDRKRGSLGSPARRAQLAAVQEGINEIEIGGRPLFHLTFYMVIVASSVEVLDEVCQRVEDFMKSKRVEFHRGKWMQPRVEYSVLPAGTDRIGQTRNMTADALGSFFPFTRREYFEPNGFPYGIHNDNGSWVVLDPYGKDVANSSHLIVGRPGMGKSAFMKRYAEIAALLGHRVFILDLEREYEALVEDLGGVYVTLSRGCPWSINVAQPGIGDDPFNEALSHIIGFLGIAVGRELSAVERRTVIPRSFHGLLDVLDIDIDDPSTWEGKRVPTLRDLQDYMADQQGPEAREIARLLYAFTSEKRYGHLFSEPTNIDVGQAPVIGFSLLGVDEDMLPAFMWAVTTLVWQEVTRAGGLQPVDLLVDEGWYLLRYPDVARELGDMGRRFRKRMAALHLATHFADDLARSEHAQTVRGAATNVLLFGQLAEESKLIGEIFGLSAVEVKRLRTAGKGEALLLWNAGQAHIPIYVPLDPRRTYLFETGAAQAADAAIRAGVQPVIVE